MANDSVRTANEMTTLMMGGSQRRIDDTSSHTITFKAFVAVTDTVIDTLMASSNDMLAAGNHNLTSKTVTAGEVWMSTHGTPYTSIQLTSGSVNLLGIIE